MMRMAAVMEQASANGNTSHTPSMCQKWGSIKRNGMINSTWRVRLIKMDLPASPTDWKSFNYGAKRFDRLMRTFWIAAGVCTVVRRCQ